MGKVMIAGFFDPIHEGHIDHIVKASKLGEYVVVVTHDDAATRKIKGRCFVPCETRVLLLKGVLLALGISGEVLVSLDGNGTVVQTLQKVLPDIYAKGGDRTPENMPLTEVAMCDTIGCEIHYGLGRLLNSSSRIKAAIM